MQIQFVQDESALKLLARQQYNEVETLLSQTSFETDDELCTAMTAKSMLVIDSIEECFKRPGHLVFQKNFLVIAKSFNSELGEYFQQCFRQKHPVHNLLYALQQVNATLANLIVAGIRQLQDEGAKRGTTVIGEASLSM